MLAGRKAHERREEENEGVAWRTRGRGGRSVNLQQPPHVEAETFDLTDGAVDVEMLHTQAIHGPNYPHHTYTLQAQFLKPSAGVYGSRFLIHYLALTARSRWPVVGHTVQLGRARLLE